MCGALLPCATTAVAVPSHYQFVLCGPHTIITTETTTIMAMTVIKKEECINIGVLSHAFENFPEK